MTKVLTRWTPEEWFIVIRYLYQTDQITLDDKHDLLHLDTKTIRRAAQEIPDPARRRNDVFLNLPQIRDKIREHLKTFKTQLEGSSLRHQPTAAPTAAPMAPPISPLAQAENTLMEALAASITDKLEPRLLERLKLFMAQAMIDYGVLRSSVSAEEVVQGKPKEEPRPKKIGLVGLLPIQVESFRSQFRGLEFKACKDESVKQTLDSLKSCDMVLVWTGKVNHGYDTALINKMGADHVRRVHGGPTEMARVLRIWLAEQK